MGCSQAAAWWCESTGKKKTDRIGLATGGAVPGGVVHGSEGEAGGLEADGVHQPLTMPAG